MLKDKKGLHDLNKTNKLVLWKQQKDESYCDQKLQKTAEVKAKNSQNQCIQYCIWVWHYFHKLEFDMFMFIT